MGQAAPHPPQWLGEPKVSMQAPSQFILPAAQPSAHLLSEQTFPGPHTVPQPPQFCGSLATLTQFPSQACSGSSQLIPQTPSSQVTLALARVGQAFPQVPQLATSARRLTQTVSHAE
jgi:hypothetical protein